VDAVDASDRRPVLVLDRSRRQRPWGVPPGNAASSREYGWFHSSDTTRTSGCGALWSGLSSGGHSPASTRSASAAIAIIASQNLSSSSIDSDSVGSTMRVPNREAHRRRVEAVVDEALGHVVDGHPRALRQRAEIEDALVRDEAGLPRVQDRVRVREPLRDVVRRDQRTLRGRTEPSGPIIAMYAYVIGRTPAEPCGADATAWGGPLAERVTGQERCEVLADSDGADARAATAVRDRERLVQVQVTHVGAECARTASPTSALRFAPSTYTVRQPHVRSRRST